MGSIIQHLRFPFSYLLLPVFLFAAIKQGGSSEDAKNAFTLFLVLHLLVYPSSNAYNSLQDKDEGSIGLIKNPSTPPKSLGLVSILFDFVALIACLSISIRTTLFVAVYILASRLYSYRKVRLKKYPILGFLTVFIFQGGWIYLICMEAFSDYGFSLWTINNLEEMLAASCLIGSIYPLSQIYQHQQDKADGVRTISMLLGKKGSFILSGILFILGSYLIMHFQISYYGLFNPLFFIYLGFQLPSLIYFNYWFYKVIQDESQANFKHTMRMSLISATCMNAFFLFVIYAG